MALFAVRGFTATSKPQVSGSDGSRHRGQVAIIAWIDVGKGPESILNYIVA
jgi:hypothetical protein